MTLTRSAATPSKSRVMGPSMVQRGIARFLSCGAPAAHSCGPRPDAAQSACDAYDISCWPKVKMYREKPSSGRGLRRCPCPYAPARAHSAAYKLRTGFRTGAWWRSATGAEGLGGLSPQASTVAAGHQCGESPPPGVLGVLVLVQPGEPAGEPVDRSLESGVEVYEVPQPLGQPVQGDLFAAAPVREFLYAAIGEVHQLPMPSAAPRDGLAGSPVASADSARPDDGGPDSAGSESVHWPSAASISALCPELCLAVEPAAGAELAGRDTRLSGRPRSSGSFSAMRGQAPMLAGSSCAHTSSSASGYRASSASSSSTGSGWSRSTRTIAVRGVPPPRRRSARS